jgi:hypothetical protein
MNVLQFRGEDLDGNRTCCTGRQVAMVLDALLASPELRSSVWYAGALETYPAFGLYEGAELEQITDIIGLIETIRAAPQLLDGVFIAINSGETPDAAWPTITADGPMEKAARNSMVELHAFDTSWIEVYTELSDLAASLRQRFGGRLVDGTATA